MMASLFPPGPTLAGIVDVLAAEHPDDVALEFPAESVTISWKALDTESRAWASTLTRAGVAPGRLVGIVLGNDSRFIPLVVGAWRVGAAVAPIPIPGSFAAAGAYAAHVDAMIADGDIEHVVHDPQLLAPLAPLMESVPEVSWIAATPMATLRSPAGPGAPVQTASVAIVQYTSGSTSAPKGVELTHANLLAGLTSYGTATGIGRGDSWGVWLPLFHDFGLISVLTALSVGASACIWPPSAFLRRPADWLADFGRRGLTHYSGPNFSFDLMIDAHVRAAPEGLDLTRWRVAVNGAEPVNPSTIDRFQKQFGPYGFRTQAMVPGYGMAEATLAVAVPQLGTTPRVLHVSRRALAAEGRARPALAASGDARSLVSVGGPVPGIELRIVSDSGERLGDRVIGEIQIKGAAVARRYHGRPPIAENGWLPTGDIGFLADGGLFIVGRSKDTIIVRGIKYHPEDIEPIAREAEGILNGRCAVVAHGETDERLAVVAETRADGGEIGRLRSDIRARLRRRLGIAEIEVFVVAPHTIPVTSSGKVRRRVLRQRLESGELGCLGDDATSPADSDTKLAPSLPTP